MEDRPTEMIDPVTGEIILPPPLETRQRIRDVFIDELGREVPDPRPMAPPVGYKKQPSIFELVREATAREVALYAANREPESFEEADDFEIDDDYDPHSPWENDFDPPWSEVRKAIAEDRAAKANLQPGKPLASGGGPAERGGSSAPKSAGSSPPSPKSEGNPED